MTTMHPVEEAALACFVAGSVVGCFFGVLAGSALRDLSAWINRTVDECGRW